MKGHYNVTILSLTSLDLHSTYVYYLLQVAYLPTLRVQDKYCMVTLQLCLGPRCHFRRPISRFACSPVLARVGEELVTRSFRSSNRPLPAFQRSKRWRFDSYLHHACAHRAELDNYVHAVSATTFCHDGLPTKSRPNLGVRGTCWKMPGPGQRAVSDPVVIVCSIASPRHNAPTLTTTRPRRNICASEIGPRTQRGRLLLPFLPSTYTAAV